jgi:hypothetical protein
VFQVQSRSQSPCDAPDKIATAQLRIDTVHLRIAHRSVPDHTPSSSGQDRSRPDPIKVARRQIHQRGKWSRPRRSRQMWFAFAQKILPSQGTSAFQPSSAGSINQLSLSVSDLPPSQQLKTTIVSEAHHTTTQAVIRFALARDRFANTLTVCPTNRLQPVKETVLYPVHNIYSSAAKNDFRTCHR